MPTRPPNPHRRRAPLVLAAIALLTASCRFVSPPKSTGPIKGAIVVRVTATPGGCAPKPKRIRAGLVEFEVRNLDAAAVSEIEVRTANFADVLGERENLVEGLSAEFEATLSWGRYIVDCPGAAEGRWPLVVTAISEHGSS